LRGEDGGSGIEDQKPGIRNRGSETEDQGTGIIERLRGTMLDESRERGNSVKKVGEIQTGASAEILGDRH
jgi:hypothetical protein